MDITLLKFLKKPLKLTLGILMLCSLNGYAQVSITCPPQINQPNDFGECGAIVVYTAPAGTGSGTNITTTLTSGLSSGSFFPVGTNTVEYTVSNDEGDSDVCSFDIVVTDTEDPVYDCPLDVVVTAAPGECDAIVNFSAPNATDNCGVISNTQIGGLPSGSVFPIGETNIDHEAMDAAGNSAFCRFKIIVEDITVPTITCPDDITVSAGPECDAVVNYVPPVGNDLCTVSNTVLTSGLGPGATFPLGITVETYTVEDVAGNSATCSFNITVEDTTPPEITCPGDISVTAALGDCDIVVNFADATATDNCALQSVSQISGQASGSVFTSGTHIIEYEATDIAGNTSTCTFEIEVLEDNFPLISCPGDITVPNDPGACDAIVIYTPPVGNDQCGPSTTVLTSGLGSGAVFPLGTTTETYTVTDESGNQTSCSFDVIVEDTEVPTITCPSDFDVILPAGECTTIVTYPAPTINDNCPGAFLTQIEGPSSGSVFTVGLKTLEFVATDAAGNSDTCTFFIDVIDNEAPTVTCPPDQNIDIPNGFCSVIVNYPDPIVDDNCPGSGYTVVSGPSNGDNVSTGVYTVEIEAFDVSGNTSTCSFQLTITENSDPVFDCPPNLTVGTDEGLCEAVVIFPLPTAIDFCSDVLVTQIGGPASGSAFPLGNTTVTFLAEDDFGNTSTCSYDIIVEDNEAPIIDCPTDLVVSTDPGNCSAIVNFTPPSITENCGGESIVQTDGPVSGSVFNIGSTPITFTATDGAGNSSECTYNIVVEDDEAPEISCPADFTFEITGGLCLAPINYPDPTVIDNCPGSTFSVLSGPLNGEDIGPGNYTVVYQAIDAAGNTSTCSFDIVVTENTPPTIDCPADISVTNDIGLCGATVTYTPPVGTDNCPGVSTVLTAGLGSGAFFPVGTTTETYTVTDGSGNAVSCSFTITVEDEEDPVIDCEADITVPAELGTCGAIVNYQIPTASDNCTAVLVPVLISGLNSGDVFPVGVNTVTFEVTDAAGNTAQCDITITVNDEESPTITCPGDIEIDAISGDCEAVVNYTDPTFNDNCPGTTISLVSGLASGASFPVGISTVTYEATDAAGNVASCSFNVTVSEDVLPTITCPEDIVQDNDLGECGAIVNYTAPIGIDNCGGAITSLISGPAPGSFFPVGITTVTYQVTDISGNIADCSFNITVEDNEAPIIDCPNNLTLSADENCEAVYSFNLPPAIDNCSAGLVVTQTEGPTSGTSLPIGTTIFTFTTEDEASNPAICSYEVTVVDDIAPIFDSCPGDITLIVDPSMCEAFLSYDEPTASDNCQATVSQVDGPANNSEVSVGVYNVSYLATDDAGNTALCDFSVTVLDTISPTITCPADFETCDTAPTFDEPTATDNCAIASIVQTGGPTSGGTFVIGENLITFEATDVNGNTSSCSFTILVNQGAPRADAGQDINTCDATTVTLNGSDAENATATWALLIGAGDIISPNSTSTEVTNLGDGANSFTYSLDPENGCPISQDTIVVTVEPGVLVDAGNDASIETGGSVVLNGAVSPSGGDIIWTPADGLSCQDCISPVASPAETTTYFLSYTTPLGCNKIDSVTVSVFEEFPNTITPNGDGVNDVWNIPGIENYPNAYVVIYNRWGSEIFQSTGYKEPWNGQRDGKDLPTASYFYVIDYKTPGKQKLNGTVNIIR
jgi:gliding motility-associated-like protein